MSGRTPGPLPLSLGVLPPPSVTMPSPRALSDFPHPALLCQGTASSPRWLSLAVLCAAGFCPPLCVRPHRHDFGSCGFSLPSLGVNSLSSETVLSADLLGHLGVSLLCSQLMPFSSSLGCLAEPTKRGSHRTGQSPQLWARLSGPCGCECLS